MVTAAGIAQRAISAFEERMAADTDLVCTASDDEMQTDAVQEALANLVGLARVGMLYTEHEIRLTDRFRRNQDLDRETEHRA